MVNLSLTTAYLASGLISFTIALYAWQRRNSPGNFQLAGLMLAATVWSLTSAMEWHANALNVKIFWSVVSYLGSQTGPVFFLLFALRYAQQDAWLRPQKIALFFIFPLATFGMAATNSWHHLVWPQINLHVTPNGTTATYLHGPWFWVQIVYAYSLLTWGVIVLLRSILFFPHPYSHQSRFLVLASLAPMAGNIVYAINPAILGGADPTPITFALTGLLLGWAIFRHQLLNIYPIARERLMENLSDGIILIDTLQRVVDVNPSARRMLGEDKAAHPDLISQPITQLLTEWPRLAEKCNENLPGQIELLVDGSQPCYLEVTASRLQNKQAEPIGYLVILHDITKQRQAEQALQRRAQELAALYDTSIDINSQLDLSRLLHAIVERAIALSGAQMGGLYLLRPATQTLELVISYNLPRDFTGTILQPGEGVSGQVAVTGEVLMIPDYTHWEGQAAAYAGVGIQRVLGVPLKTKGQILGVLNVADTQESGIYTEEQIRLVSLFADQASIAVENARLFGELQEANAQLEMLATTDKLTGAYNRRKFDDVLSYEIRKSQRYHQPVALVMFDIDHFKQVNDTCGHQAGDQALIELVKLVREHIRGSDWLARWGGEEFMVLAPGITLDQATILAEKIRGLIDTHHFTSVDHITVSMGVSEYRPGDSTELMTQRVDAALYKAKDAGRNCYAVV